MTVARENIQITTTAMSVQLHGVHTQTADMFLCGPLCNEASHIVHVFVQLAADLSVIKTDTDFCKVPANCCTLTSGFCGCPH